MEYTNAAKDCLAVFQPSPFKDALLQLTEYVHKRKT